MAFVLLIHLAASVLPYCHLEVEASMRVTTNQAMYQPGSQIVCHIDSLQPETIALQLKLLHLNQVVFEKTVCTDLTNISFALPNQDQVGYLLVIEGLDSQGKVRDTSMTGIDCSSSWVKFPRYGYLWDYEEYADTVGKVKELCRYHINGLQFYDWQYRHHMPISPDRKKWRDWSGREVSGETIKKYLNGAHEHGMVCLAYNMIYAGNLSYLADGSGVDTAWRLVKANGEDFTCEMDANCGPVGILQYFNPLNPGWQQYIFSRELEVFSSFAFDGWHGDTIGEMGVMLTPEGEPLGYDDDGKPIWQVKDTYTRFLNLVKEAIGAKYLVFNPVGAQGIENVNVSKADVLYTEFWPWDCDDRGLPYNDYYSIHRAILQAAEQSGGKSLVVAGYINYKNPCASFNIPAVLLMDSVVFASGGARIELGNGGGMLSNEYFPDDNRKVMNAKLCASIQRMYDFIVAYENLLRDGQRPVDRVVNIEKTPVSINGQSDTVWCFAKADGMREIYHFINLIGTDSGWQDKDQTKKVPKYQKNLKVTIHTSFPAKEVSFASPDADDLTIQTLFFETGTDDQGDYLTFTLPKLVYWDMIFLR